MNNRTFLVLLLLLAITFITFLPALNNSFTNLDDDLYITANPLIKSLNFESIKTMFLYNLYHLYTPLPLLSFALEYKFFKLVPFYYILDNILLHLASTALVFFLIKQLSENIRVSFFTALLFAIHPMHIESVAWISERKDLLCGLFYFSSLCLYLMYLKSGKRRCLYSSVLLYIPSMLSKPMGITLPIILLLIDKFNGRKFTHSVFMEKIPFFIIGGLIAAVSLFGPEYTSLELNVPRGFSLDNVFNTIYSITFYIKKLFIPFKLSCLYPLPGGEMANLSLPHLYAFFLFGLICSVFWLFFRKNRIIFFGIMFYFVSILPASGIINSGGKALVFNHYTYLSYTGLFFIIAHYFVRSAAGKLKYPLYLIAGVVFTFMSLYSMERVQTWANGKTLMTNVIDHYPNLPMAYYNRGHHYNQLKNYPEAMRDYTMAIALDPGYLQAYFNRGIIFLTQGKYDEALQDFNSTINLMPTHSRAYTCKGLAFAAKGDNSRAILNYSKALALSPRSFIAYNDRGEAYLRLGDYKNAGDDFMAAISINPKFPNAYAGLGTVFFNTGHDNLALRNFTFAIEYNPNFAYAYYMRGLINRKLGNNEEFLRDMVLAHNTGYVVPEDIFLETQEIYKQWRTGDETEHQY